MKGENILEVHILRELRDYPGNHRKLNLVVGCGSKFVAEEDNYNKKIKMLSLLSTNVYKACSELKLKLTTSQTLSNTNPAH